MAVRKKVPGSGGSADEIMNIGTSVSVGGNNLPGQGNPVRVKVTYPSDPSDLHENEDENVSCRCICDVNNDQ